MHDWMVTMAALTLEAAVKHFAVIPRFVSQAEDSQERAGDDLPLLRPGSKRSSPLKL